MNLTFKIYFACHQGNGLLGRIIRWASRGRFAHVSILIPLYPEAHYEDEDVIIYEAREGRGVQAGGPYLHLGETVDLYSLTVTAQQFAAACSWLEAQVGKKYDWLAIAGFVLRRNQQLRKGEGIWFCSELAAALAQHIGQPLFRDTAPYQITPVWFARSTVLQPVPPAESARLTPAAPAL